jgi:hypothetical protein
MIKIMPDKIATAASYCVSGTLVCGGSVSQWIHNLDWNQVAIGSGVVIGIATFIVNVWYKQQMLKTYKSAVERGIISPPEQEE